MTRRRVRHAGIGAGMLVVCLIAAAAAWRAWRPAPAPGSDADARIAFYEARLGGVATYPAYAGLGHAYLQKARETGDWRYFADAQRYLEASNARQPNDWALRGLAAAYLARHRFDDALRAAEELVRAVPNDLEARAALFDAHLAAGNHDAAAALLDTWPDPDPSIVRLTRVSNLREAEGRIEEARAAIARACPLARTATARAWCEVRAGSLALAACDAQGAEQAYERALAAVAGYYLAREHLAELRAGQGRTHEALVLYDDLRRAFPSPLYTLAVADLEEGSDPAAAARLRADARAALRASAATGSRAGWRPLALLLLAEDATVAEGVRWAERDWENRKDAFAADTLAWARFRAGNLADAERLMATARRHGTHLPAILIHAAEIAAAGGRPAEARVLMAQASGCPEALAPGERRAVTRLQRHLRALGD